MIGVVTVIAGVGGGVVFTPLVLGFSNVDSHVVRATGLFVALVGALVTAKPFLRRGLANMRLLLWAAGPYAVCCCAGAVLAGHVKDTCGTTGEAALRGALGLIVIGIAALYMFGGRKSDYPEVNNVSKFTESLGLGMSYHEDSLGRTVSYKVKRAGVSLVLFCIIGLISGFFGMGAGWAMVPAFNLVMLAPLKAAAASARVLIGIGDTAAIWPYADKGGLIPLFVVPCMVGTVLGSIIGAKIMFKIKVSFVRYLIIGILLLAGVKLIMRAVEMTSEAGGASSVSLVGETGIGGG